MAQVGRQVGRTITEAEIEARRINVKNHILWEFQAFKQSHPDDDNTELYIRCHCHYYCLCICIAHIQIPHIDAGEVLQPVEFEFFYLCQPFRPTFKVHCLCYLWDKNILWRFLILYFMLCKGHISYNAKKKHLHIYI